MMKLLIANGVEMDDEILAVAALEKNFEMVCLLVGTTTTDFAGTPRPEAIGTALRLAAGTCHLEMVQFLLQELNYCPTTISVDEQRLLNEALWATFDPDNVTHMWMADWEKEIDWEVAMQIFKLLVATGGSVDAKDDNSGRTPLRNAVALERLPLELIDYLLSQGADVNARDSNVYKRSAFFRLLIRLDATEEMVDRFKRMGGNWNIPDELGNTPLHLVQNPQIARILLNWGVNPDAKNIFSKTPLDTATNDGRTDIIAVLRDHEANMELKSHYGVSTPSNEFAPDG
jgi:hypothetical protein